jgi:hypothetical protein
MKLSMDALVGGVMVDVVVNIDTSLASMENGLGTTLSDDAANRITMAFRREVQRAAEIAFVDLKDQKTAQEEALRIRALPKDRPAIIVLAGTKELELDGQPTVHVLRGTYKVGPPASPRAISAPDAKKTTGGQ